MTPARAGPGQAHACTSSRRVLAARRCGASRARGGEAHAGHRLSARRRRAQALPARATARASAWKCCRSAPTCACTKDASGRARQGQGDRAAVYDTRLRASLGYLEQRHALAPVRRAAQAPTARRSARRRVEVARCRRSLQALRRRRGLRLQPRRHVARVRGAHRRTQRAAGRPTSISTRPRWRLRGAGRISPPANPAWDTQPVFLTNGDLAWLAQDRPGFEADRFHIDAARCAQRARCARSPRHGIARSARLGATPDGTTLLATARTSARRRSSRSIRKIGKPQPSSSARARSPATRRRGTGSSIPGPTSAPRRILYASG